MCCHSEAQPEGSAALAEGTTREPRCTGTPQAPTAGARGQQQIQQRGGGRLGAGHTAWEELCAPTRSPSCLRPHTPRLGPGMYSSYLAKAQRASMKGRACKSQEKLPAAQAFSQGSPTLSQPAGSMCFPIQSWPQLPAPLTSACSLGNLA